MLRHAIVALMVGIIVAGCSGGGTAPRLSTPTPVPTSALDGLLLDVDAINAVMGTTGMTPDQPFNEMRDHSILMPNLNCLGIWEIGEKAIYGPSRFAAVRGQAMREPHTDAWDSRVEEAVVSFLSANAANKFYEESSDRWSKCTNHTVNLTVNGHPRTTYSFGGLTKTGDELTMPMSRTGYDGRSCQRSLALDNNVIIDVAACSQAVTNQAHSIVDKIRSRIPA